MFLATRNCVVLASGDESSASDDGVRDLSRDL